jgi:hypothetical protein
MTTEIKKGNGANGTYNVRRGREITREENNTLTIRETWECDTPSFLTYLPERSDANADYPTTFLSGPAVGKDVNGITKYTLIYTGFDPTAGGGTDPDDSPPRYWWDGSERTIPVEYNPNYGELVDFTDAAGKSPLDRNGRFAGWPEGAVAEDFEVLTGVTDYLGMAGTWNCERFSTSEPDVSKSCTYTDDPPGGPPDIGPDHNWLYLTPSYEKLSPTVYKIRERWMPSGGGHVWSTNLYEAY